MTVPSRAKIGVIIPSTNTSVEADYNALRPPNVSFHIARVYIDNSIDSDDKAQRTLQQIRDGSERAVHDVLTCQPDHLILGMSSETFVGGLEGSQALIRKMEEMSGLKVSAGSEATRQALETVGARRIAVLTPYQPSIDSQIERYFDDLGYDMVAMKSLRCPTAVSIADVGDREILAAIDALREAGDADAFVQAGTNLSSYRLAGEIERRTGKPFIPINAATVWHALRSLGINDPLEDAAACWRGLVHPPPDRGDHVHTVDEIRAEGLQEMFSADAIRFGNLLFVSGCVPLEADGTLVGRGDIEAQTRKTLSNLELVLKAAGTDFRHVLKTTVFMTDISQRGVTHALRREVFGAQPPASTMVEVSALGGEGIEIEIDAIASILS